MEEVVMPQMGESVAEGTVTEWFKEVGEWVDRDEALLEITTDKVDSEVASPAEGVLVERLVEPGETVEVDSVIAVLDPEAEEGEGAEIDVDVAEESGGDGGSDSEVDSSADGGASGEISDDQTSDGPTDADSAPTALADRAHDDFPSREELRRQRSTPLVRRIADEHGIDDLSRIEGSGISGRVTKEDILAYVEEGRHERQAPARGASSEPARREVEAPELDVGPRDRVETMSPHRQTIAEHMVQSRSVAAHAHTVHEVDFGRVEQVRDELREDFADRGAKLTYTAFIVKAAADALVEYPSVNASVGGEGEEIVYRGEINVGVAVALEESLVVPVIENVDELSLLGIARRVNDVAERARNRQLDNDEVEGGTFTVSNHGIFGPEFGIPIINQPQAAIVSTGAIKKRVVVDQETEAIQVRPTSFWCLSFDHRIVDGATADRFLRTMRENIEQWET
ncbi:MAG: dihydrolipoamide acetyltransferase family protein [Bradymonadaceae bacterium]